MKFLPKYQIEDYINTQINYLTVIKSSDILGTGGSKQWEFRCICGATVLAIPSKVISGQKKSCGCMRYKVPHAPPKNRDNFRRVDPEKFIGQKNESLTVIGYTAPSEKGRLKLECRCDCCNITYVYPYQFVRGDIKSCGCARFGHSACHIGNVSRKTHGLSKNPFYKRWNDMIRRCYNPKEPAYRFYGALGIGVCNEWRESPHSFIKWCEDTYPAGQKLSLDRIEGSRNYSPDNCRWITQAEQVHNLKNNRFITINDETHCITEWCTLLKISAGSVYKKVHRGMSFEDAILLTHKNRKVKD